MKRVLSAEKNQIRPKTVQHVLEMLCPAQFCVLVQLCDVKPSETDARTPSQWSAGKEGRSKCQEEEEVWMQE